jgi:hypothetical protein
MTKKREYDIPPDQELLGAPRHKHHHPGLPRRGWEVWYPGSGDAGKITEILGVEHFEPGCVGQIYIKIDNGRGVWKYAYWNNVYCYDYEDTEQEDER